VITRFDAVEHRRNDNNAHVAKRLRKGEVSSSRKDVSERRFQLQSDPATTLEFPLDRKINKITVNQREMKRAIARYRVTLRDAETLLASSRTRKPFWKHISGSRDRCRERNLKINSGQRSGRQKSRF